MTGEPYSPQRAANRLVRVTELYAGSHGIARFPVDVRALALETARIFGWTDPISEVRGADITGFEGALIPGNERKEWLLLYSNAATSPGRTRFTLAHELGHYILHRLAKGALRCSHEDMLNWSVDERNIEAEADLFASYLLMPLDDFRRQATATVDLEFSASVQIATACLLRRPSSSGYSAPMSLQCWSYPMTASSTGHLRVNTRSRRELSFGHAAR